MRYIIPVATWLLVACSVGTAANSSASPNDSSAAAACGSLGYSTMIPADTRATKVIGAYTLRAADLAQQDETPRGGATGPRPGRSPYRDYAPDTPIFLCFFDGFIAAPGGPPPLPPATFREYERYVVTIDPAGSPRLAVAGHRDSITVAPRLP
jgi:hypothetical protein